MYLAMYLAMYFAMYLALYLAVYKWAKNEWRLRFMSDWRL